MPEIKVQDIASKLRSERFDRTGPAIPTLADPISDTPMIVTLDELRPYELNPRIMQNPKYDEIRASIRERGLDAPPAITRRPNEPHFIIRNGGNTRLSILRELWSETKDERFFRIPCLFRPWSARGEIVALTGHLAENELHGELSFIERALGVAKARELYEQETGNSLSQRELARRLKADGYPISHSLISRMHETLLHLLPAIPTILYNGLGKHQVERLIALRKAGVRVWERHVPTPSATDFVALFEEVLSGFDANPAEFDIARVHDELIKQMVKLLASDYDTLALEIIDAEDISDALHRDPAGQPAMNAPFTLESRTSPRSSLATGAAKPIAAPKEPKADRTPPPKQFDPVARTGAQSSALRESNSDLDSEESDDDLSEDGAPLLPEDVSVEQSGADDSDAKRGPIAAARWDGAPSLFSAFHIDPLLYTPDQLRSRLASLATDIAREGSVSHRLLAVNQGIGYICAQIRTGTTEPPLELFQRALLSLLSTLSAPCSDSTAVIDGEDLRTTLGALLQGSPDGTLLPQAMPRLSDAGLLNLFQMICLARRLHDVAAGGNPRHVPHTV